MYVFNLDRVGMILGCGNYFVSQFYNLLIRSKPSLFLQFLNHLTMVKVSNDYSRGFGTKRILKQQTAFGSQRPI